jgi:hypothetical protein
MNPETRKFQSESKLRSLGIRVNEHLPMIETEEETSVRSREEVFYRLLSLWAVVGKAFMGHKARFATYIQKHDLVNRLSDLERAYLLNETPSERDAIHFSWQLEAFYFIAWSAGLLDASEIPTEESSVESILDLFPKEDEEAKLLMDSIRLRSKSELLDRADLLYRLHWATRDAHLNGTTLPKGINGGVVQEWHRAANWMINYDNENNWDFVGTDT